MAVLIPSRDTKFDISRGLLIPVEAFERAQEMVILCLPSNVFLKIK
jgi:hypothetical protein